MFKDIDWGAKLSSRKFWSLLAALIVSVLMLLRFPEEQIMQVVAAVGAFASIFIYILAEAYVDGNREVIEYYIEGDDDE